MGPISKSVHFQEDTNGASDKIIDVDQRMERQLNFSTPHGKDAGMVIEEEKRKLVDDIEDDDNDDFLLELEKWMAEDQEIQELTSQRPTMKADEWLHII